MKKVLWDLFKKTGNFKYYIFFKELEREEGNENRKSKGNRVE